MEARGSASAPFVGPSSSRPAAYEASSPDEPGAPFGPLRLNESDPKVLFAALYDELSRLAHRHVQRSRPGDTMCTTALVHEAYLKLGQGPSAVDRHHFFALAARAMHQILVDYARQHASLKRGGGLEVTTLEDAKAHVPALAADVLALDEALTRLGAANDRLRQVVELRFFAGLSVEETAAVMEVSAITVKRDWRAGRAFLLDALGSAPS